MHFLKLFMALTIASLGMNAAAQTADEPIIGKQQPSPGTELMTPENLWAMGRIGSVAQSPDGTALAYTVTYYSVKQNRSHTTIHLLDMETRADKQLTVGAGSESSPVFIKNGTRIAYLAAADGKSQVWEMNLDGSGRRQLSFSETDVIDFLFSPDGKQVILIHEVPQHTAIQQNDEDLPKATGMVINDLMYKHWDTYVTTAPHPFVAAFDGERVGQETDLLAGEPFECPMMPFGGIEQLAWSPDSKTIAYTCRKKTGRDYAISTDSDIFIYSTADGTTRNVCKPEGWKAPDCDPLRSLEQQEVNNQKDALVGYDQNPQFSPDGRYLSWLSMERDGYESDRTRLCVMELATGKKQFVTEAFQSGVNEFCWDAKSQKIYFTGVWYGRTNIYATDLKGTVKQLTDEVCDYSLVGIAPNGKQLIAKRHSMSSADEIYAVSLGKNIVAEALTKENEAFYKQLAFGEVKERRVKTVDGQEELCWVVYPPKFDPTKKYPVLLFCEGGPQSPVSQFWSYRWNFQIMVANGYIVIAPNRRGLPGFGMEWLEEISGDYNGLCMKDYLSAIDDIATEPYVDRERLGAVGASFGGYSVYWLAGHHNKRFKCFIAHDGIFNTEQQYVETEELWFPNWDLRNAPWIRDREGRQRSWFEDSPHRSVDKWDTPILCIHGQKDFRIEYTQAESAFTAARLRGVPAQLLLFPDENHWVLKPQNGVLWQRTFFRWLDKWLKYPQSPKVSRVGAFCKTPGK